MSFNGSGTWVPPAGQPVASGTVIQSTTHNTLVTDIGNSFNNTLPRDGQAPMQGQLKITDGTSSIPGIAFNSEASTGMFRPTAGVLGLSVSGVEGLRLNSAGRIVIGSTSDDGTNKLQVNGPAKVTGAATLASTLDVAGATTLSTLSTSGAATVGTTLNVTGAVTAASFNGPLAGNAASATKLQTVRKINGVAFDGSADITVADATKLPLTGHVGQLNGGMAVDISNTDLNNATATGFYRGNALANAPDTGWWFILVESHDNKVGAAGWTKQTATAYGSGNTSPAGTIYTRYQFGTTAWSSWTRIGTAAGDAALDFAGKNITASGSIAASGVGGFLSTAYAVNARNPIWRFGNADNYGLSYFQGGSGIGGQDTIGLHFGTPTALASPFSFRQDGTSWFGNALNVNQGGLLLDNGGDFTLKPKAGSGDPGDIVWVDQGGGENHRLWCDFAQSSLLYRYKGGTAYKLWHEGNLYPSESAEPSSIVRRTTNGYINGNYIWMSDDSSPDSPGTGGNGKGTPVTGIIAKQGDNYYRTVSAAYIKSFLNLKGADIQTARMDQSADIGVGRTIRWTNYGNGHVIFDASNGLSPEGKAIDRANPAYEWSSTYPTLMGWNGNDTYGVRVDSARFSDYTKQTTFGNVGTAGIGYGGYGSVNISGQTGGYSGFSFSDMNCAFMINTTYSGVYRGNSAWDWRWDNGTLAVGNVPAERISGTVANASNASSAFSSTVANQLRRNGDPNSPGMVFYWDGQAGQPTWLWGGEDGVSMKVYNPSNFNVRSAGILNGAAHTNGSDGWFRSSGECGLYNETYDTGIYATAWRQVRTYNGSSFYSEGDLSAAGNVGAYSDERLKTNWRDVKPNFVNRLAKVKSGVYDRTDVTLTQAGVSAQSWRRLLPQTVMKDKQGMLSVNYGAAALVSSVELAKEVVQLKKDLTKAMKLIEKLTKKLGGV